MAVITKPVILDETGLKIVDAINAIASAKEIQSGNLPMASIDYIGKIIQYTGVTTASFKHGYFYECIEQPVGTYKWSPIPVSDAEPDSITSEELSNMWND